MQISTTVFESCESSQIFQFDFIGQKWIFVIVEDFEKNTKIFSEIFVKIGSLGRFVLTLTI